MRKETSQPHETDLDKTDKLPVLDVSEYERDLADGAVRLDYSAGMPGVPVVSSPGAASDFARPSSLDLPSLAETVRSVEERIARQTAEHDALQRTYERTRDAEAAALMRANTLAAEIASSHAALELEQARSRDFEKTLAERTAAAELARSRAEESVREAERLQGETRALKESLATRDATIVQVLHSLGERDAQLLTLQREHARIVPALEESSKSSSQLETELHSAQGQAAALAAELKDNKAALARITAQLDQSNAELAAVRLELTAVKMQSSDYLDVLRTRDWRQGFHHNMFRELDAEVGAAQAGMGALEHERDKLDRYAAEVDAKLARQAETIDKLEHEVAQNAEALSARNGELQQSQRDCADLAARLAALGAERVQLSELLTEREASIEQARSSGTDEVRQFKQQLAAAEQEILAQAAQMARLKSDAETAQQEITVLIAHLQEARRPMQTVEAEVKRLTDELAVKALRITEIDDENAKLRASLERTRGALEEREFLIRRLERSESNNANVLGRIQTSIERLGTAPPPAAAARPDAEWSAELIRIDGEAPVTHVLGRRSRVGRAPGCELLIDSTSVSRHHALILAGPREAIIEDLNSTNGVFVNGRKITRQQLNDGDSVTVGEAQFRFAMRQAPRTRD
jgi:chromosome segregation ATPase